MRYRSGFLITGTLLLLAVLLCGPAAAQKEMPWQLSAGMTRADVGLDENRTGLSLGVGRCVPFRDDIFDFTFTAEYVQKAGNQPRVFVDSTATEFVGDEEIRLHYAQPSVFLGVRRPGWPVLPRIYAGVSMGLKFHESWSRPVEDNLEILSYDETDFVTHVGFSLQKENLALDFRYSFGMVSQLNVEQTEFPTLKDDYSLEGVDEPEDGAKLKNWQLGAVWIF